MIQKDTDPMLNAATVFSIPLILHALRVSRAQEKDRGRTTSAEIVGVVLPVAAVRQQAGDAREQILFLVGPLEIFGGISFR